MPIVPFASAQEDFPLLLQLAPFFLADRRARLLRLRKLDEFMQKALNPR
jgi:hypothetical protein